MSSRFNRQGFSNRVRAKDDDPFVEGAGQHAQAGTDQDVHASSQASDIDVTTGMLDQKSRSTKYHFTHDQLNHADEISRPAE
ncbi:hypothetical protein BDV25DRAFT_154050 [Aspergillus avenaceus]|uniref:Uncharacterized protein n=1 Tax=Aspergillus avenaceus TaxID=36643 RepID=A0A5N6TX46_ASPAV|nr:hypothetical protein BDV25DRAFT_154050 [Aspergillus avenaceus]